MQETVAFNYRIVHLLMLHELFRGQVVKEIRKIEYNLFNGIRYAGLLKGE